MLCAGDEKAHKSMTGSVSFTADETFKARRAALKAAVLAAEAEGKVEIHKDPFPALRVSSVSISPALLLILK